MTILINWMRNESESEKVYIIYVVKTHKCTQVLKRGNKKIMAISEKHIGNNKYNDINDDNVNNVCIDIVAHVAVEDVEVIMVELLKI